LLNSLAILQAPANPPQSAAGKKKKRSVNRKSGGVRRFEAREHH
jgi:hypothetical protein